MDLCPWCDMPIGGRMISCSWCGFRIPREQQLEEDSDADVFSQILGSMCSKKYHDVFGHDIDVFCTRCGRKIASGRFPLKLFEN